MSSTMQLQRMWQRARRLAPRTLIFAWAAFWLSSAFLPCHEAIAAFGGEPSQEAPSAVVTPHLTHGDGTAHIPHFDHAPHLGCENPAKAESTGSAPKQVLWHPPVTWAASKALLATMLSVPSVPDSLAPHWIPPPPHRFNARTLRLLI